MDKNEISAVETPVIDVGEVSQAAGEVALLGVGTLAEVIGAEEARKWFDERDARRAFLYDRALVRHGFAKGLAQRRPHPRRWR